MRARRHFLPSLDVLPTRLAPSGLAVMLSPLDSLSGAASTTHTSIVSPTDPLSGGSSGPSVAEPTSIDRGSYTPPVTTTMSC
jgi:hypothetical protein